MNQLKKQPKGINKKKNDLLSKRLLENYYSVIFKLIRLHYSKPVLRIGLDCLMKFINRMPVQFVTQVITNLKSIFALIELDGVVIIDKKLKLIRVMLSLWKKVNFEDQLENYFLQKKLFNCFKELINSEKKSFSNHSIEDCFVNFDNLVMKPNLSDSSVVLNWFILLLQLCEIPEVDKIKEICLFLMNKMVEKYEKLNYFLDPNDESDNKILVRDLMTLENKTLSLKNGLLNILSNCKGNNKLKYLCQTLIEKKTLGKKYIGMDLKKFMNNYK